MRIRKFLANNARILREWVKRFSLMGVDRALSVKIDGGISFGSLFDFFQRTRILFSYFTAEQGVPEDFEIASKEKVIKLIFN